MADADQTPEQVAGDILSRAGVGKKAKAKAGRLRKVRPIRVKRDDGAALLDDVYKLLARFVVYPSEHAHVAHVLWIAHAHLMDAWESTPRIAFLSPEPGSGKTRSLEVTELLVPDPVATINATPAYIFRKCRDEDGAPTILFDEIDSVFGAKAKEHEELRALLNSGHRRGAMVGRCVVHGKTVLTEEVPSYAAVAMAGLGWLPDTILSRSIIVRMRRRAPDESVEPFRRRVHAPEGEKLCRQLAGWSEIILDEATNARPAMPNGIEDRSADNWESLLAVADIAGASWPQRAREAALALVAVSRDLEPSLNLRLLADLRTVFGDDDAMATKDIIAALCELEEAPWSDLKGKPITDHQLSRRLRQYEVKPKLIRIGEIVCRGYAKADLYDVWRRYLPSLSVSAKDVTPVTPVTASDGHVTDVTDVTASAETERQPGLSQWQIDRLATEVEDWAYARRDTEPNPDLDKEIRHRLRQAGVLPEAIKLEVERVLSAVFTPVRGCS